ncbi:CYTH and CHAD domain-containing protein [Cellulomonas sp. Marseille-Q8402]
MADTHREVERKYAAGSEVALPPLTELLAGTAVLPDGAAPATAAEQEVELAATYFDTDDLRLAAAGLTLRRRTGGDDAGWHLKVPAGTDTRSEVRVPAGRAVRTVPAELRGTVRAVTRGATLRPVAEVRTARTVRRLVDASGRVLLEVVDDRVTARRVRPVGGSGDATGAAGTWREIEVELVDGGEELLDAVEDRLRALGVKPARSRSKLARVLGHDVAVPDASAGLAASSSAGDVVLAYLVAQDAQLREQDLRIRLGEPDAVHRARVAARRLRNALKTFGPLFDPAVARPLRDELGWLAHELGTARDAEVLRGRVRAGAEDQDPDDVALSAAAEADSDLGRAARETLDAVRAQLDSDRYHRLLQDLHALVSAPPFTGRAGGRARKLLPERVAKRDARVRRRLERARRMPPGRRRDEALHAARKSAKSARYAGEAVRSVLGKHAARYARAMEDLQEVLGEHQDSVVARRRLRDLARHASSTDVAFLYGRLHAQEEARGRAAEDAVADAWRGAKGAKLRRWLR